MTRKKWNRLRRQRPELFQRLPPAESWSKYEGNVMRLVGKREAISRMTSWVIENSPGAHWLYRLEPLVDYDTEFEKAINSSL